MDIIRMLKTDGILLKNIPSKDQSIEICKEAIKQNPLAMQYASPKSLDSKICLAAVKKDAQAFRYVPRQFITKKMCEVAVGEDPELLNNVPERLKTPMICVTAIEQKINTLSYISREKRYELFNEKTEIHLIEKVIAYKPEWLGYMPNRLDVRELCIRLMEVDFSLSQYLPDQIKMSEDILNYQKSKGCLKFKHKYYDSVEEQFKAQIIITCIPHKITSDERNLTEVLYCVEKTFRDFNQVYDFLDGNLYDAELRDYSFRGIDLKEYNIEGAIINSRILQSQGLYDNTYYEAVKRTLNKYSNKSVKINEILVPNEFYYPKPVDDFGVDRFDMSRTSFFYVSDIHLTHRVRNKFKNVATKEEIHSYIKFLAQSMVSSIGTIPINAYLLIAGDTSSFFAFSVVFYNELIKLWPPNKIVVVSGNHELWNPDIEMEDNIQVYRLFFNRLGINYLQNDLLLVNSEGEHKIIDEEELLKMDKLEIREQSLYCSTIILGGLGFTGLNEEFNATNNIYGKSFAHLSKSDALLKDKQETNRFNAIYEKTMEGLGNSRVIVLTHTKKGDWNSKAHNTQWIYLNGHNHRNFYEVSDRRIVYADNQIGYNSNQIGLKYFYCDNDYDIFAYYSDGIYEITKSQYVDFNRGKRITMSFNKMDGTIYMLKRDNIYMFLIYCEYSKHSKRKFLYLMNGGKLVKLSKNILEDLAFYYENLAKYAENVRQLLYKYAGCQQKLSDFIKHLGGSGKIHGCIVDVERPDELEGFSYCHLFINPIDGKVTPYFAYDVKSRIVYKDFKTLLQAQNCCRLLENNYLRLEQEAPNNLPIVRYSETVGGWDGDGCIYDEESQIYGISRIIKSLQYCTEKNVVRLWNEDLLNYDFANRIKHSNRINEVINDRLMMDAKFDFV